MSLDLVLAIALFGFATSVSPGPNNTVLLTMGANFGLKKSLGYIAGILAGLTGMIIAVGFGLGIIFATVPVIYQILKWVGFAYILWLAFLIVRSKGKVAEGEAERIGFFRSTAFQFVNPKAWIVVTSFMASYAPVEEGAFELAIAGAVFLIATYPGAFVWAAFGRLIKNWIQEPKRRRVFNIVAASLLVLSMVPVLLIS